MTTQHKRGIDKGGGFDGAIADITRPTSHMPTVEASLTACTQFERHPNMEPYAVLSTHISAHKLGCPGPQYALWA